ncbi:hypothetical protein [Hirschia maritima]|uniref:hypothetical protein n=1 Tax=Hirschia maritima TaxID=1121961 RepID=UPI0003828417|nr:hypothetical protein [Hirschia maritima]
MRKLIIATSLTCLLSAPAFANVGSCEKPTELSVPANVDQLSFEEFQSLHAQGQSYMSNARDYLKCLDGIIYSTVPEDPIVSKAGKAHSTYGEEWGIVWGQLNLACVNWEVAHGTQFPGGCQPQNPTAG